MDEVGFSKEYTALQLRYGALKERVANQIEMLRALVSTTGPCIKARYMMFVGHLEYKVYELKVELNRWKRRFSLRQAALNRGEPPDLAAIEVALKREFVEFMAEIKRRTKEMEEDERLFSSKKLSAEKHTALRVAYLNAIKKLHPDLNPNLPKAARDLWDAIQSAYDAHDWNAVRLLAALADCVAADGDDFASAPDAVATLRAACAKLEGRMRELTDEANRIQEDVPFTYRSFLEDEDAVEERQNELKMDIAELKDKIAKYEKEWKNG